MVVLSMTGCNLLRKVDNKKSDIKENTQTETTTNRTIEEKVEGGKIKSDIKPESEREKDSLTGLYKELVETFKDGGLTKTIYYKPDGSVAVDCEHEAFLRRIIEQILEKEDSQKEEKVQEKDSEKELKTPIDWTIVSLGVMGLIAVALFKKL